MSHIIEWAIFIASTAASIAFMIRLRRKADRGTVDPAPLTTAERPMVLVLVILSPLVAGAIFYYGWIKRLPKKAAQANNWSIIVFVILLAFYIILGIE